ncbi:hypothetical protein [Roseisolibacter agri]|uniref:Lipoprotein n=1 Tax=Roseisolibacter agri TaxID=2014610 RepID=A0AA37QJS7_9BACT|nr:hypothetical protein [Roseisolibacter agri]GLC27098.1 hypothetical protein rosag_36110 [Roseisolibacter agri]
MHRPSPSAARRAAARRPLLPALALVALAACGGGAKPASGDATSGDSAAGDNLVARTRAAAARDEGPVVCGPGTDEALTLAVREYIKQATPKPQRFLVSVGTDSALPEAGQRALQDKGPMYLFPAQPALQQQMRTLLHDKGDYTTLLLVLRDATRRDSTATVRLDGHYVGGEDDGKPAGPRVYQVSCAAGKWRLAGAAPERGA